MTTHNGPQHSARRADWWADAHYVDGAPYIGGRGTPLIDRLRNSYLTEAAELTNDLAEVVSELEPADAGLVLGQVVTVLRNALPTELAEQLSRLQVTMEGAARAMVHDDPGPETQPSPTAQPDWTWRGDTGGPLVHREVREPAGPEAATEAPIVEAETVLPGHGDDPADPSTEQRAIVGDFLTAAGTTAAAIEANRQQPQSKRARGRTRKAAGA